MYFTEDNARRIDGMRLDIERLYKDHILSQREYAYLLASLLESVLRVSNTSGTYQAYFKFWETGRFKRLTIEPLAMEECPAVDANNNVSCCDANELARRISGDIVYLDPPYTATQYTNMYHVLETIARYDSPELFGKTGRRKNRTLSVIRTSIRLKLNLKIYSANWTSGMFLSAIATNPLYHWKNSWS